MTSDPGRPVGYVELLRRNPGVRRLWAAQVVSELGDWLNMVALFQLIATLSPSARAAGLVLILQLLPLVAWSPLAGLVADRFDRRRIMILTDIVRSVVVLGFLFIDQVGELPLLYALAALQFSATAFFEPARSALLPSLARGRDLVAANALAGMTWSVMLAVGGIVGGLITALLSPAAAFRVDSVTFLVSAAILSRLQVPAKGSPGPSTTVGLGLADTLAYLRAHPRVAALLLIKTGITLTGGGLWLLSLVYGQKVFPIGRDGGISVGLFYGAHGLGAVVGAVVANRILGGRRTLRSILDAFLLRFLFFVGFGFAAWFSLALLASIAIAACGSLLWVASTTLLQEQVEDRVLGRVFALDWAGLTLAMAMTVHFTGHALDVWQLSAPTVARLTALIGIPVALAWWWVLRRWPGWGREQDESRSIS